jgi:SAM-dependent methyltransferase
MRTRSKLVLSFLPVLWLTEAHAQQAAEPPRDLELSKQQSIYFSAPDEKLEGYTVNRPLAHYADGLASGFDAALKRLGPRDRWLDIGAGEGNAILDYYTVRTGWDPKVTNAEAVAVSIEDRRTPLWQETAGRVGEKIRYLSGKRFGAYSEEELGRFQLITDVMGGFSYTDNLSRFMEHALSALAVNGTFFTVLQDIHREDGANRPFYAGSPYLTEIVKTDGSEMKVCAWLKRISCVQVTCEARNWEPPTEAFRITKVCDNVNVPALETVHYQAGTPPERRFKLREEAPARIVSKGGEEG